MSRLMPPAEIAYKASLVAEIRALKANRRAIILGHNYMEPALFHMVTDVRGDSLELARAGAKLEGDLIVFCGVRFMAETAKILSPEKKVLIPSPDAGCSLAQSIRAEDVRALRRAFPGVPVVTYVNTYADVKAESDICCTSANASRIIAALRSDTVIFLPDEFLAQNVARETGKSILFPTFADPDLNLNATNHKPANLQKVILGWQGRCEVHARFRPKDIDDVRRQFPDVIVLAHPECPPEVVEGADFSGSTARMLEYVQNNPDKDRPMLLLTECAMADNIIAADPARAVLRLCSVRCPHMNEISLEQLRDALLHDRYEVLVDPEVAQRARQALKRMLEF